MQRAVAEGRGPAPPPGARPHLGPRHARPQAAACGDKSSYRFKNRLNETLQVLKCPDRMYPFDDVTLMSHIYVPQLDRRIAPV